MRRPVPGSILLSLALSIALSASGTAAGPPTLPPQRSALPDAAIHRDSDPGIFRNLRGALCPDIAHTDLFRKNGLSYLHTREFAGSVSAVAEGTSSFSPPEIPAHWPAAAHAWRMHLLAHEWAGTRGEAGAPSVGSIPGAPPYDLRVPWEEFPDAGETCSPFLLYLASREYRSRSGHEGARIVSPYLVPAAVDELEERIRPFAYRASEIVARLGKARELDAEKCAPGRLTLANASLAEARDRVWTDHYDAGSVDPLFARTAVAADDLLTERRHAQRHGFLCYSR